MLTDEQVATAAAETMVDDVAIRAATLSLCGSPDAHTPADVIAVTIRLLHQDPSRTAPAHWSNAPATRWH
jgi:hypothetical protein